MYAYVDGIRAVRVGVYFCHMVLDDLREVVVPVVQGIVEDLHDVRRIHGAAAGRAPADDVLQLRLADAELVQLVPQLGKIVKAIQQGSEAVLDLRIDRGQLRPLLLQILRGAVHHVGNALRLCLEIGLQKIYFELLDNESLDLVGVDALRAAGVRPVPVAAHIAPGLIALGILRGVADVGRAALLALDQAGEQIGVFGLIGRPALVVAHSFLHLLPCGLIDNGRDDPLQADTGRIRRSARPFAEQFHPSLVPGVCPDVALIREDAVEAVLSQRLAALPCGAADGLQDYVIALPFPVHGEDRPHDPGLRGVYHIVPIHDIIAQGSNAAEEFPLFGFDGHAVDALLPSAQDLRLSHAHGEQLHKEVLAVREIAQALRGGDHRHAQHHHGLAEAEPVSHVSRAAGDVIDHHGVELPTAGGTHKPLEAGAVGIGSGLGLIGEGGRDGDVMFPAVLPDLFELVFDAVLCLMIGAVPCVSGCVHNVLLFLHPPPLCGTIWAHGCLDLWNWLGCLCI